MAKPSLALSGRKFVQFGSDSPLICWLAMRLLELLEVRSCADKTAQNRTDNRANIVLTRKILIGNAALNAARSACFWVRSANGIPSDALQHGWSFFPEQDKRHWLSRVLSSLSDCEIICFCSSDDQFAAIPGDCVLPPRELTDNKGELPTGSAPRWRCCWP